MKGIPTIAAYMTPFPYSVDIKDTVAAALSIMKERDIRHLPVMSDGSPRSIVTHREIDHVLAIYAGEKTEENLTVGDTCAIEGYLVEVDMRVDKVLDEMVRRHIGSAIVTKDGRLAGIFTSVDACKHFSKYLKKVYGLQGPGTDAA